MTDSDVTSARLSQRLPLGLRTRLAWLKRRVASHPLLDDPVFIQWSDWLAETEQWSLPALKQYQFERLQALLRVAYTQTFFYRRLYEAHKVKPDDIRSLDDMYKLPIITKEDIRANLEDMIPRRLNRKDLRFLTTSGSTGEPLGLYHDATTIEQVEMAFIMRQWRWAGYRRGDPYASFRGHILRLEKHKGRRELWDYVTDDNRLALLAHDTAEATLQAAVQKLRAFKPRFIQTYPSTLEIVARYMQRNNIDDIHVDAVFCESETLYPHQRALIEDAFHTHVFAGYGHSERAVDAVECEAHMGYHVSMEYGILELLDDDNQPITTPGQPGHVVGTGLDTFSMPIIRYMTDDVASYAAGPCPCGRAHPLIKDIAGRNADFIVSQTGQLYPFGPIYASVGDEAPEVWQQVREVRFIQSTPGHLTVEAALSPIGDQQALQQHLLSSLYDWINPDEFTIAFDMVDAVARNPRGKIKLLEQRVPIDLHDLGTATVPPVRKGAERLGKGRDS